jgi:hypothetical protein
LIKVKACGVCGTDLHIHEGEFIAKVWEASYILKGVVGALHFSIGRLETVRYLDGYHQQANPSISLSSILLPKLMSDLNSSLLFLVRTLFDRLCNCSFDHIIPSGLSGSVGHGQAKKNAEILIHGFGTWSHNIPFWRKLSIAVIDLTEDLLFLGHETVGVVAAIGPAVKGFTVGERVVAE